MSEATTDPKPPAASQGPKEGHVPRRWYQWMLVYPTLALALLSAAPQWADVLWRLFKDSDVSRAEAEQMLAFLHRNWDCAKSPPFWVETPVGTAVDGTICSDTGDVFLQIKPPNGEPFMRGIFVDEMVGQRASLAALVSAAHAATAPVGRSVAPAGPLAPIPAQQVAITLCQEWETERIVLRHVQVDDICYDERYDGYDGKQISREEVPCRGSC